MLSEAAIAEALIGLLQPRDGQSADTWIIRALVEKVTLFTDSVRIMYTTREIDGIDPKPESLENTALQPAENDGSFLNILGTPGAMAKEPYLTSGWGSFMIECAREILNA